MKYMGSKARIAKEILPIILKDRKPNQWYVEPFAGGMNMIENVDGKRVANDKNFHLIEMWKGLQKGYEYPKTITKELYSEARNKYNSKTEIDLGLVGWIGWMGSYNGRFFDGGYSGHNVNGRDYIAEQIRNTLLQVEKLKDVKFVSKNYSEFEFKELCIIYCDPPYENTKQYATSKNFNHEEFWQWCRDMSKQGHQVFISEYNAPDDFTCVWSKEVTNSMNTIKTYKPVEKLFVYNEL